MKISKIAFVNSNRSYELIFEVTFTPNWLESLFGVKERVELFKDTGFTYRGGGNVYIRKNGKELGLYNSTGKAIDKFRNGFNPW